MEALAPTATRWQKALFTLIEQIPQELRWEIRAIAIDGTSSTVLLCDATGEPIDEPILYNDGRGVVVMETLKAILFQSRSVNAPSNHVVLSATSSLAKLLWLMQNAKCKIENSYFLHQADWLALDRKSGSAGM